MTTAKLHILQHALGVGDFCDKESYRNHFITGPGSSDYENCISLVADGFMSRRTGSSISGYDDIFHVTQAGIGYVATASPKRPKLSKSKQRYKRYLEYGDSFDSFIGFCRWDAEPARSWNGGAA